MFPRAWTERIRDILDAIAEIETFTQGMAFDTFRNDPKTIRTGNLPITIIAIFNDTIEIIGDNNSAFSAPGDSGSVILERDTGRPVALLFAGDGRTTTACDLGAVCQQFQAFPV